MSIYGGKFVAMKCVLDATAACVCCVKMPLNYSGVGDNISNRFKGRFIVIGSVMCARAHRCVKHLCSLVVAAPIYYSDSCAQLDSLACHKLETSFRVI